MQNQENDFSFVNYGIVTSVKDGVIQVSGLDVLKAGEMIQVGEQKVSALVLNLEAKSSKAIILGSDSSVSEGDVVTQANMPVRVGVNTSLFGRVVDGLGNKIDGQEDFIFDQLYDIDVKAPGIVARQPVH